VELQIFKILKQNAKHKTLQKPPPYKRSDYTVKREGGGSKIAKVGVFFELDGSAIARAYW